MSDYEELFSTLEKTSQKAEDQPERVVETELRTAVDNPDAVVQIMWQSEQEKNINLQAEFRRLMREHSCDRREAAMRHFQKLYDAAVPVAVNGKMECAEVYPTDIGYEGEFYREKYGRLPETREEVIQWWLEYDAENTIPVGGGIRHNITVQEQANQLMAMSDYAAGIMGRVRTLYSEKKFDKVVALLTDCDIHKRVIELVPIAKEKIFANKHKLARVITEYDKHLEKMNDC